MPVVDNVVAARSSDSPEVQGYWAGTSVSYTYTIAIAGVEESDIDSTIGNRRRGSLDCEFGS